MESQTTFEDAEALQPPPPQRLRRGVPRIARLCRDALQACTPGYGAAFVQSSLFIGVINVYHIYFFFAAMVIAWTISVNILLTWFIQWFQVTRGSVDNVEELSLGLYVAVFLRSGLLIYLVSRLMWCGCWLMQDAVRQEAFQLYRRTLCGGAVKELMSSNVDAVGRLGSRESWTYTSKALGCLDMLVQLFLYGSFDIAPPVTAIVAWRRGSSMADSFSTAASVACLAAASHVTLFYIALTLSEIVARVLAFPKRSGGRILGGGSSSSGGGASAFLSRTALDSQEDASSPHSEVSQGVAMVPLFFDDAVAQQAQAPSSAAGADPPRPYSFPLSSVASSDPVWTPRPSFTLGAHRVPIRTAASAPVLQAIDASGSSLGGDGPDAGKVRVGAPWNLCFVLCGCWQTAVVGLMSILVMVYLIATAVLRLLNRQDMNPVAIELAIMVAVGIGLFQVRSLVKRFWLLVRMDSNPTPAGRGDLHFTDPQRRRLMRYLWHIQRWSELHTGGAPDYLSPQYDLVVAFLALHLGILCVLSWTRGIFTLLISIFLVLLRRVMLGRLRPWAWIIRLSEAVGLLLLAVGVNYVYSIRDYGHLTLLLAASTQLLLGRQHVKHFRFYLWMTFSLHVALTLIIALSMLSALQPQSDFSAFCDPVTNPYCRYFNTEMLPIKRRENASYAFCEMQFWLDRPWSTTSSDRALSLADFARLSVLAYESNRTLKDSLHRWFPGWHVVFQRSTDHGHLHPDSSSKAALYNDWTTFIELVDPTDSTSVISVRGTHSYLDMLQDLNIWSPIAIPQLASLFGPDLSSVGMHGLRLFSHLIYGQWMQKKYYEDLLQYVRHRTQESPGRRYYLTGHSLGGGLAKLVSAELSVPAITFSSPGLQSTRQMLTTGSETEMVQQLEELHKISYTVVPDNDLVPRVDEQVGTVVKIACEEGPLGCHHFGQTLCQLLFSCGRQGKPYLVNCNLCPKLSRDFPGCQG
eukprot:TRINITY_DN8705_c0_g1_i1.p1 TRINITY_DN8705_c0_g1~~TRINITY_DN8705_c0_g1_i1.p1  ORF type:complete len:973 (-),score=141.40 TRINITY_DN8705_c0_g1_i1:2-2920(-)